MTRTIVTCDLCTATFDGIAFKVLITDDRPDYPITRGGDACLECGAKLQKIIADKAWGKHDSNRAI